MPPSTAAISSETWTAERLVRGSYTDLGPPSKVEELFLDHLLQTCRPALEALLSANSHTTRDYSLELDVFELCWANPVLGQMLIKYPSTLLSLVENAIVQAQRSLLQQIQQDPTAATTQAIASLDASQREKLSVKGDKGSTSTSSGKNKGVPATRVHARLVNLPPTCCRASVARMGAADVGKIVQLSGTVVRTSTVQMYESARTYKCTGKNGCSRTFLQKADLEQRSNALVKPDRCPHLLENRQRCPGTNLKVEANGSVHTDYQEVKIQEGASKVGIGSIPRSLLIKLQHDLVDRCQPGDEVVVVGSLLAQWQQPNTFPGVECSVGMAIEAHSIQVVQENGSSAWDQSTGEASHSIQLEHFKKEFDNYWADPRRRRDNPIAARDFICQAVCPKLYGLQVIKLALLITLIGGVSSNSFTQVDEENDPSHRRGSGTPSTFPETPQQNNSTSNGPEPFRMTINHQPPQTNPVVYNLEGTSTTPRHHSNNSTNQNPSQKAKRGETTVQTRRRDMSHLLLIGDPGTGKSQILRFAAALCPRSVLTTGVGTTSAGLTCAAVREGNDKEFALEAGALVLADKGICCIDEFGCIRNEDRTTIHEAMEQQTLSVAKAGIVCKLNCRATVIAVMNPRACIYDNQASLSSNTGLGTPLLSRFDLIFKLVDSSDLDRDNNVTTYLLNRAIQGTGFDCSSSGVGGTNDASNATPWSIEKLRAYISIVKDRFQPTISDSAALLLELHYEKVRSAQSSVIPVTVRFLESLIRLTQAHARLMYRNEAILEDAVAVLRVMECSAYSYGGFDGDVPDIENFMYRDPMSMDICDSSPDEDFLVFEYQILRRYRLLEHMREDRKARASALLEGGDTSGTGDVSAGSQWQGVVTARDFQQDHYGRSYTSPTPRSTSKRQRRS